MTRSNNWLRSDSKLTLEETRQSRMSVRGRRADFFDRAGAALRAFDIFRPGRLEMTIESRSGRISMVSEFGRSATP
jgi:hypothetical protein